MAKTEINTEEVAKVIEGCVYCESSTGHGETFYTDDGGFFADVVGKTLEIGAGYGVTGSFKINFCPECGREL